MDQNQSQQKSPQTPENDKRQREAFRVLGDFLLHPESPLAPPKPIGMGFHPHALVDSRASAETLAKMWMDIAKRVFGDDNKINLATFLFCQKDPLTGASRPEVWNIEALRCTDKSKEMLAQVSRVLSLVGDAIATIFVSEAWILVCKDGKIPDIRPSESPDRQEVLILLMEHPKLPNGRSAWCCDITTPPEDGKRTLGEWKSFGSDMSDGRFTELCLPILNIHKN